MIHRSAPPLPQRYAAFVPRRFNSSLFLSSCLLGGLGDLSTTLVGLFNRLDDTYGNGLTHVTDGETAEGRVVSEGLNAHWFGGNHLDDSSIARLDEFR